MIIICNNCKRRIKMRKLLIWLVMLIIIISLVSTFGSIGCRATKNKIAFVSDRDDDLEIYIMNIDGSNQERLTFNESNDMIGSFSN